MPNTSPSGNVRVHSEENVTIRSVLNDVRAASIMTAIVLVCAAGCARYDDAEPVHANLKGYLFINELVASSTTTDDWIELYNPTTGAIDLSGFWLSDDISEPLRWAFPKGTVIRSRGFLVIMADNKNKGLSTNFRLGSSEAVVLTTPGGTTTIDSIVYTKLDAPQDCSYGRSPDGADVWQTFPSPTGGRPNS
jgi:hypothetical protein